ncbi:MAG: lysostaphin resistance A-like protein [Aeromonas sp.]
MLPLPDSLIWGLLALAVPLALFRQRLPAFGLLALSLLLALWLGRITPAALLMTAAGLLLAWRTPTLPSRWATVARVVLIVWSMALTLHLIPGFNNLKVLDQVLAGPASVPFNMYLNLDKPLLIFALLLAFPAFCGKGGAIRWRPLALLPLPLAALLVLAWQLGALRPEIGLPHWWWLFALNNLLFTCIVEEALFRGAIQQALAKRYHTTVAIVVAAILFGAHHLAGGPLLVLFATLAGCCYGLAFQLSGRLSVAILVHFAFNFAHLALFTYPLARA